MSTELHGWRRVARWIRRGTLGLIALVALVVAAAVVTVHTDWGRDYVRRQLVSTLQQTFRGKVSIGRLEGSPFGTLVVRDVVIDDADGRPAVTIDRVALHVKLLGLVREHLHLSMLDVDGVTVLARDGSDGKLNLAELMVPSDGKGGSGAWGIAIDEVVVRHAAIDYAAGGEVAHLDDVAIDGGLDLPARGPIAATLHARATWREKGVPVIVGTSLDKSANELDLGALQVTVGEVAVVAQHVRVRGSRVAGRVFVAATAGGVRVLAPSSPLVGDAAVTLELRPIDGPEDGRAAVTFAGMVGGATFEGAGAIDPLARRVEAAVRVRGVDVAAIVRGGERSSIDGLALIDLVLRADRRGIAALDGGVQVIAGGGYRAARFDAIDLGLGFHEGDVAVALRGAAPARTALRLDGVAALGAGGAIEVRDASLALRTDDIGRAAGGAVAARGALAVDLIGSGRVLGGVMTLAARGRLVGSNLHAQGYGARRLAIEFDGRGLPYQPTGRAHVVLDDLSRAGRPILGRLVADARSRPDRRIDVQVASQPPTAPWRIELAANVGISRTQVDVALGAHRIRAGGVDWTGHGGTIVVDATTVVARGVSAGVAGGQLAFDATYHHAGAREGDAEVAVTAAHLDLADLDRSFGLGGFLRGVVDGSASGARRSGILRGSIDARAAALVARVGAPPIDVRVVGTAAPGDVALRVAVSGGKLGALSLDVAIDAPRRLDDVRAWTRLDRRAVRGGTLVIAGLDVAQVARVFGDRTVRGGLIDGKLAFDAGGATGTIRARGVDAPWLPALLDAALSVSTDAKGMTVGFAAAARGLATAKGTVSVAFPDHPFDPIEWHDFDPDDFLGAHVQLDGDLRDQELARRLGLATPVHGQGSLEVDIAPELASATVVARVHGLHGGWIVEPIDGMVTLAIDPRGVAGHVATTIQDRPLVTGDFSTSTTPRALLAALESDDPAALRALPVRGSLAIDGVAIGAVLKALGRGGEAPPGTASIAIAIGGTLGEPTGKVTATVAGLASDKVVIDQLVTTMTWHGDTFDLTVTGTERGGGTLALAATGEGGHLDTVTGTLRATRFDLAPLARLAPPSLGIAGVVDADLALTGASLERGTIAGHLHVADAQVPLYPLVGTLHRADISVVAQGDGVKVTAAGEVGHGTMELTASAKMTGLLPSAGSADVTMKEVTLIDEAQPRFDGMAHLDLKHAGALWNLDVKLGKVFVTLPDDAGEKLHPPGVPGDIVFVQNGRVPLIAIAPAPRRTLGIGERPDQPYLVATVDIGRLHIESKELRGIVTGRITATVGADAIALDGAFDAGRCEVTLSDRRYRVDRAVIGFDGSADPLLDVRLVHDFPEATLYVSLRGRLSDPKLSLASDPNTYNQGDLLGFLLGGEPGAAPAQGVQDAASGIASSFLSNRVKAYAQQWTGVSFDVLKFEAPTASSSSAVTIGKWVSQKLFVAYRQRVAGRYDENSSEAEAEYWLGRRVVIDGTAGDRGVDGVDLIWTRRW